jgi:hypothetical protein
MKEAFSFENWTLWEQDDQYWNMDYDVVTHGCGWLHKRKVINAYEMTTDSSCSSCGEVIPDEVVGVWKLKNMDKIQRDHGEDTFYASAFWNAPSHI